MKISLNEFKKTVRQEVRSFLKEADYDDKDFDLSIFDVDKLEKKPMKRLQQKAFGKKIEVPEETQEEKIKQWLNTWNIDSLSRFKEFLNRTEQNLQTIANELGTNKTMISNIKNLKGGNTFLRKIENVINKDKDVSKDPFDFDNVETDQSDYESAIKKILMGMINVGKATRQQRTGKREKMAFSDDDISAMARDPNIFKLIKAVYVTQIIRAQMAQVLVKMLVEELEKQDTSTDQGIKHYNWLMDQINGMIRLMKENNLFAVHRGPDDPAGEQQRLFFYDDPHEKREEDKEDNEDDSEEEIEDEPDELDEPSEKELKRVERLVPAKKR